MNIISNKKKFVESKYAPDNTNVYWVTKVGNKFKSIKEFINGKWNDIMGVKDESDNSNSLPADYVLPKTMSGLTKLHVDLQYSPWDKQAVIYIYEGDLQMINDAYYQAVFLPVNIYSSDYNELVPASSAVIKTSSDVTPNTTIYSNLIYSRMNSHTLYNVTQIDFPENFIEKYKAE